MPEEVRYSPDIVSIPPSAARLGRRGDDNTHGRGDHQRVLTVENVPSDPNVIAHEIW
ncbi:MAG: hypothetical protein IIA89_15285 [Chloroflexi bacterium]|nr:hypothetical protein [Chloroflexota bacterium]